MTNELAFNARSEAAAFVAALSRYLNSPASTLPNRSEARVWYRPGTPGGKVQLYLSDRALEATASVFSPVPDITAQLTDPPQGSVLVLEGGTTPPLGLEEAEQRLTTAGG